MKIQEIEFKCIIEDSTEDVFKKFRNSEDIEITFIGKIVSISSHSLKKIIITEIEIKGKDGSCMII